jgi:type I restriction enzyme, S subunit
MSKIAEGYKQTEVGVIPSDWNLNTYGEIFKFLTTATYSRAQLNENDEINYVHYGDIHTKCEHFLDCDKLNLPSIKKELLKNYPLLKDGDLIIVDASEDYEGVGKSVEVRNIKTKKIISGLHTFLLRDKKETIANGFKGYIHSNKLVKKQMDTLATGLKVYGVSKTNLLKILIPLPPTKAEQTAIATALNDADALITQLEKLIAKKRNIKQGAMQELLKPKEGWEVKKLGEVATLKARIGWHGLTTAEYRKSGDYFLITGTEFKNGFIDWENCVYVDEERYKQDKNIQIREHDVLVTKDGTIGKVALIKSVPKPATLNSGVFVIRPINNSFYPEFFYYQLLSEVFIKFLSQLSAGSTINHLYQKDFVSFQFLTPKIIEEQQEIAQILSGMDTEIEALEKKFEKYKMIKQGMMQDLLTGKIRLV